MSKLSKNIIYNFAGRLIIIILGFLSVKYIFKLLGDDVLGIIFFTVMVNAVLTGVLDAGVNNTTVREVSAYYHDEPEYICNYLSNCSLYYWGATILFAFLVFYSSPFLVNRWFILKTIDKPTATYILRILGIASLLAFPKSLYTSIFVGLEKMEINNIIDVTSMALQQFGIIIILWMGGTLNTVIYWIAIYYIINVLLYLIMLPNYFPLRALLPGFSLGILKRNARFSSRMMLISVTATIHRYFDKIILSKLVPIGEVGYYGIAYGGIQKTTLITSAIRNAAFPQLSSLFKNGDHDNLLRQYLKLQEFLCFIILPVFSLIIFISFPVFSYILNLEAATLLLLPITLLCVGYYMNGTLTIPYIYSLAVGKPEITARTNVLAIIAVTPITVILIYYLGLVGASLSWICYHLFVYLYAVPILCRECLNISVKSWYMHVLKNIGVAALIYGTGWLIHIKHGNLSSLLSLSIAYLISSLLFLASGYILIGNDLWKSLLRKLNISRVDN